VNSKVEAGFNEQIKNELAAGYLYLAMSAHFQAQNLVGFAHWMRLQAEEELSHAMRLFDYVIRRGGRINLHAIDAPAGEFGSAASVFEDVFEHEREVTGMIHRLYEVSAAEGDWAAQQELQWFISEQVEEEDSASTAKEQVRLAGDDQAALLMLDQQFGARVARAEEVPE
jgi:ferritin